MDQRSNHRIPIVSFAASIALALIAVMMGAGGCPFTITSNGGGAFLDLFSLFGIQSSNANSNGDHDFDFNANGFFNINVNLNSGGTNTNSIFNGNDNLNLNDNIDLSNLNLNANANINFNLNGFNGNEEIPDDNGDVFNGNF